MAMVDFCPPFEKGCIMSKKFKIGDLVYAGTDQWLGIIIEIGYNGFNDFYVVHSPNNTNGWFENIWLTKVA